MQALGLLGGLASLLEGSQQPQYQDQSAAAAASLQAQGQQLSNYLSSGTLPPGVAAGLQTAHDSAAATIRSQYAARGQTGSSAEMQDLANLANVTVSQGASIATNLLNSGISEQEYSAGLYEQLMQASLQQNESLAQSIGQFSSSLVSLGTPRTATYTLTPAQTTQASTALAGTSS